MNTPPFLIGAVLLFWGWQTGFLVIGAIMAVVLESARFIKARWEFSDDDFSRIWTLCTLVFLGVAIYAFTDSGGPSQIGNFLQNPSSANQTGASVVTSRTASAMLRWLPMVMFLFVAAQAYSTRQEIPLSTISLILRRRWKKAAKLGKPLPAMRGMNVSFPYFAICLVTASVHPAGDANSYFWGLCALLAWALWSRRTRRYGVAIWGGALAAAFVLGYFGQFGIGRLQSYIQSIDAQWFERFARRRGTDPTLSKTQIGHIGQMKLSGKIVIRVEPHDGGSAPDYLREASYRVLEGSTWKALASRDNFQTVSQETNSLAFVLIPNKITAAKANITCYLDNTGESGIPAGLLPLPTGSSRLEQLRAWVLKMNSLGSVLAEGPGLVTFDANYGPGATIDAVFNPGESVLYTNSTSGRLPKYQKQPETNDILLINPDLFVNSKEEPALSQVVSNWNVPRGNRVLAMRAIGGFFQSNFTYSTWQDLPDFRSMKQTNQTPIGIFLLRSRRGHCEYFATATALLLRKLGVPARYAVGYAVHEKSGGEYVVRLRDAHAWCLVWNEKSQSWQDFDTTPASWIDEEAKNASIFQKLSDLSTWFGFQFSKFRWGQSDLRKYMLVSIAPLLGVLVYQIFFRQKRRRKNAGSAEAARLWPGLDSEFYLIERKLSKRGIIRHPNEPLSDWLRRALADPALSAAGDPLRVLLQLHYRYRFDPQGLTETDREKLRSEADRCLQKLAAVRD